MIAISEQNDPIVEILRLAYRRGLALRQEQAKDSVQTASSIDDAKSSTHVESQSEEGKDQN
jgi:hypothetical protein